MLPTITAAKRGWVTSTILLWYSNPLFFFVGARKNETTYCVIYLGFYPGLTEMLLHYVLYTTIIFLSSCGYVISEHHVSETLVDLNKIFSSRRRAPK